MSLLPGQPIRLAILSMPCYLPIVRSAIEKTCQLIGFGSEATGGIVLSVDEALANVIKHAYKGEAGKPIEIELLCTGETHIQGLQVSVRDWGMHVDPSEIKPRELSDIRPGGLGVHIMKKCMDSVEYLQANGGGTLLVMSKKLSCPTE